MKKYKVYPFRKSKDVFDKKSWWTVEVYDSVAELRKASMGRCKTCKGAKMGGSRECLGLTHQHGYKVTVDDFGNIKKCDVSGELGKILLCKQHDGGGVVSHEMAHAMLYTSQRYTNVINFQDGMFKNADEWMAGIVGNLVNSFYTQYLCSELDRKSKKSD